MKKKKGKQSGFRILLLVLILILAAAAGVLVWMIRQDLGQKPDRQQAAGTEEENEKTQKEEQEKESEDSQTETDREVQSVLGQMTLDEKIDQLFMITPEQLTGVSTAVQAGETTREAIREHPVGGLIYFARNLQNPDQTRQMLSNTRDYAEEASGLPVFLSVDEEGGQVTRIASNANFHVPVFDNMSQVGQRGDLQEAVRIGSQIGAYLKDLGFNMDAAPDVDVLTNPDNQVVRYRSFGSDPRKVADMARSVLQGLREQGITGMYKHFPGHGGTTADSHQGYAYVEENLEQLKSGALVPFQDGISNGLQVIMVSHIACPNVTGDDTPATFSSMLVTDVLRKQMGFEGMVITDALNMGAVTEKYSSGEAAVLALQAGADLLLMPENYQEARQGIVQAVHSGTISEERINESVARILKIKLSMPEQ